MKLPKDIVGKNRLRDLYVCELYLKGMMPSQIVEALVTSTQPLRLSRINKILSANAAYINPRMGWSKSKRLHRLQRLADLNPDKLAKNKDMIDILEAIRKEIEGDKSLVDMSKHEHITIVVDSTAAKEVGFEVHPELSAK
jgi:hypothetical protein